MTDWLFESDDQQRVLTLDLFKLALGLYSTRSSSMQVNWIARDLVQSYTQAVVVLVFQRGPLSEVQTVAVGTCWSWPLFVDHRSLGPPFPS